MHSMTIRPIGHVSVTPEGFFLVLTPPYASGLTALEGFTHLQILWWFSGCDDDTSRSTLTVPRPYQGAPETMGVFATRSPMRPNPIALSTAQVLYIQPEAGRIALAYIDAEDQTPILDIKPYTPSLDRVSVPHVPAWCAHWPQDYESSANFDWSKVFVE